MWIIELKSDIVEQLHSPLRVMGLLTLSIPPPRLMGSSRSLLTMALTTEIYHLGSNKISTRKLSDGVLGGLAMVEFIKSCTQVAEMFSAEGGGKEPWGWRQHQPLLWLPSRPPAAPPGWDERVGGCVQVGPAWS